MPPNNQTQAFLSIVVLIAASFLLFFNLGSYALWDDEATTALFAQSVWKTGDTNAMIGQNIVAYNSGVELKDFRNRFIPPLPFYLAALFVGQAPGSALAARIPFAFCGLVTLGIVLFWLRRSQASQITWILMCLGFLTNVSFFLFFRQCRYFGPAVLFSVLVAYFYHFRDNRTKTTVILSLFSFLLLCSNYLCYAGVVGSLAADYFFWGKKEKPWNRKQIILFLTSQLVLGAVLVSFYNPLLIDVWGVSRKPWIIEKGFLFLWNWRDFNRCELGVGAIIGLLAPVLALVHNDRRLWRCFQVFFVYVVVVSAISPQPINLLSVAFVRYLVPLIPLGILITVMSVQLIRVHSKLLALSIIVLSFFTNVLHGGSLAGIDDKTIFSQVIARGTVRSTIFNYISEILNPPPSAYRETAQWIRQNLSSRDSLWVTPDYAAYPLMYHAPAPLYAWQIEKDIAQFKDLPRIHFKGEEVPDYIIAFGIYVYQAKQIMQDYSSRGINFRLVKQINLYWYDLTRPELFWHTFKHIRQFSKEEEGVYIFKRIGSD